MLHRNVVDQLLDQYGFSHAGAAEQADLAAARIRLQQIDHLDARLQQLHGGALLVECRRLAVNALQGRTLRQRALAVDGLSQYVEHPAQRRLSHRHPDGVAGNLHRVAARQPLAWRKHNAAHQIAPQMLRDLHHAENAVLFHVQFLPQLRQRAVFDLYIHNRAGDLCDDPSLQIAHLSFLCFCLWAFAPALTSVISCVMAVCRTRL